MDKVFLNNPLMERKRRQRLNASHHWTDAEAYQLVLEVSKEIKKSAASYEKPTAQKFYTSISSRNKQLKNIPWTVMKAKMRYLRDTFIYKKRGPADDEFVAKKCPNLELLNFIFDEQRKLEMENRESMLESSIEFFDGETSVGYSDSKYGEDYDSKIDYNMGTQTEQSKSEKKKRLRLSGGHWWSQEETATFIKNILEAVGNDPKKFEQPCARIFYENHCKKGILNNIEWGLMRSKMRYFKVLFLKAEKWLEDVGTELFQSDNKHITTRLHSICPYYDELKPIFESRLQIDPIRVPWSSMAAKMPDQQKTNHEQGHNAQNVFKVENGADNEDSLMRSEEPATEAAEEEDEDTETQTAEQDFEADDYDAADDYDDMLTPKVVLEGKNFRRSAYELQREKLDFEKHKFEIECEQRKNRDELQKQLLEMEKEKLAFEKEKLRAREDLKKYEIDRNIELKKLELGKDERLRKLELEYKYKHGLNFSDVLEETEQLEDVTHEELL